MDNKKSKIFKYYRHRVTIIDQPMEEESTSVVKARTNMSDINWHRVFATSSLVVAIILICGSIYLHLQQKHHLGRLRYGNTEEWSANHDDSYKKELELLFAITHMSDAYSQHIKINTTNLKDFHEECLMCLCKTVTRCEPAKCGNTENNCGYFRISRGYWIDAGEPKLTDDVDDEDMDKCYSNCVNDPPCAVRTIIGYMNKYSKKISIDCNDDGIIDCRDFIALHILGPTGCKLQNEMAQIFETRMKTCLAHYE